LLKLHFLFKKSTLGHASLITNIQVLINQLIYHSNLTSYEKFPILAGTHTREVRTFLNFKIYLDKKTKKYVYNKN